MNRSLALFLATAVILGAINWGLIGFFNWNLVDAIFGGGAQEITSAGSRVVYAIVGLCGVLLIPYALQRREPMHPV